MNRRTMLAGAAALAAAPMVVPGARAQAAKTKIVFWHAMTGANNDEINRIARDFNAAQDAVELEPVFKGSYPETLTAAIAAWKPARRSIRPLTCRPCAATTAWPTGAWRRCR